MHTAVHLLWQTCAKAAPTEFTSTSSRTTRPSASLGQEPAKRGASTLDTACLPTGANPKRMSIGPALAMLHPK